jgi:pyruvate kinase
VDAKGATITAKKYFEDTKTLRKFIFETASAKKDGENWTVVCLVQDLFEDIGKKFKIIIDDEGKILNVEKIDQSPL